METVLKTLNNLVRHDKLVHFFYGNIIFTLTILILNFFINFNTATLVSLTIVTIFAIGKEVYDYINIYFHTPDIYDFIYTIANPLIFTLLIFFN